MAPGGASWREKLIISFCLILSALCSEASPLTPTTSLRIVGGFRQQEQKRGEGGGERGTYLEDFDKENGGLGRGDLANRSGPGSVEEIREEEEEKRAATDEGENQHDERGGERRRRSSSGVCNLDSACELECPHEREAGSAVSFVCSKTAPPHCRTLWLEGVSGRIGMACISTEIPKARLVSLIVH